MSSIFCLLAQTLAVAFPFLPYLILQSPTRTLSTQAKSSTNPALPTALFHFAASSPAMVLIGFAFQLEVGPLLLSSEGQEPDTIRLVRFYILSVYASGPALTHPLASPCMACCFLNSRPISFLSVPLLVTFSPITELLSSVWAGCSYFTSLSNYFLLVFHIPSQRGLG